MLTLTHVNIKIMLIFTNIIAAKVLEIVALSCVVLQAVYSATCKNEKNGELLLGRKTMTGDKEQRK